VRYRCSSRNFITSGDQIGTASGGTAFLLSRCAPPQSRLVTLDIGTRPGQPEALSLLAGPDRSITSLIADQHISVIEGSIGAFPRRLLVKADEWSAARRALRDAGLDAWLIADGEVHA